MNRSSYFIRPWSRRGTGERDGGGGGSSCSSSNVGKKASSFWWGTARGSSTTSSSSTSSSSALTAANGGGHASLSSVHASRSSSTTTSNNHSSLPPSSSTSSSSLPQTKAYPNINADFWRFVDHVIFTRIATKGRAPLVELVEGIRNENYPLNLFGQAHIDELLAPVEAKAAYASLEHVPAMTVQVAWVTLPEFKSMCTAPAAAAAPAAGAAASAASTTTTSSTSSSIVPLEGQVVSPKRRRANHDHEGGLALSLPSSSTTTTSFSFSSSSSSSPHVSIPAGLEINRENLIALLQGISDEYKPQGGSQAEVEAAAAEARVEGVLAAFGARTGSMAEALAAVEETLQRKTEARKEAGGRDRRDRQAEMEARMAVDLNEVLVRERMAPLTEEEQEEIHRLLRQGRDTDVVVSGFNVDMCRQDIRTCAPCTWLNDEVINFFMNLLKQRDDALVAAAVAKGEERRKNWFFNSFFISKLLDDDKGYKFANVKRWSRKAGDLFTFDKVIFPVNIGNSHWCLAVIHMQEKKIQYFDSLVGTGREYLPHLRRYLQDEHQDKKKVALDLSGWELVYSDRQVVPQQANGADCGCFASAFAYLLSEGLPIKYISQADMPAFRQRLVMSIMKKALTW